MSAIVNSALYSGWVQHRRFAKRNIDALLNEDGKNTPYTGPNSFGSSLFQVGRSLEPMTASG